MNKYVFFILISLSNVSYAACFGCVISQCFVVSGPGFAKCYSGVYREGDTTQRTCALMGSGCNTMQTRSVDDNRLVKADSDDCQGGNLNQFILPVSFNTNNGKVSESDCGMATNEQGGSVKNCGIFPADYATLKTAVNFKSIAFAFRASDESLIAIAKYDPDLGQAALTFFKPVMSNLRLSQSDFPVTGSSSASTRASVVKQILERSTIQQRDWKIHSEASLEDGKTKPTQLEIETHKISSVQFRIVIESMTPEVSLLKITRFFENSKVKPMSVFIEFRPAPGDPTTFVLSTYSFQ